MSLIYGASGEHEDTMTHTVPNNNYSFPEVSTIMMPYINYTTSYNRTDDVSNSTAADDEMGQRLSIGILLAQAVAMFGVGCNVDYRLVWHYLHKPKAYLLGIFLQMFVLPLIAWVFTYMLNMNDIETLAVLLTGTSPGGNLSNLVVLWIEGVVDLSVAMTGTSTIFSLAAIPCWIYVFSAITQTELEIPFTKIAISLATFLVPILFGILLKSFVSNKVAKIVTGLSVGVGCLGMMGFAVVISVVRRIAWHFNIKLMVASISLPMIGYALGHLIAALPCFHFKSDIRRTIGIEVAIQNVAIASAILQGSFMNNPEHLSATIAFPSMYFGCELIHAFIITFTYKCLKRKGVCGDKSDSVDLPQEVSPQESSEKKDPNGVIITMSSIQEDQLTSISKTVSFDNEAFAGGENNADASTA